MRHEPVQEDIGFGIGSFEAVQLLSVGFNGKFADCRRGIYPAKLIDSPCTNSGDPLDEVPRAPSACTTGVETAPC